MVKASAGQALLKRLDNERAMKGTLSVTSMFQKAQKKSEADDPMDSAADNSEAATTVAAVSANKALVVPAAGDSTQGSEPPGFQGDQETSPKQTRRRRLIAASDDEDEEADKQAAEASEVAADADEDKQGDIVPSGDYIQGVSVVNGDVGSDSEADKAASNSGSSSEDEENEEDESSSTKTGKKVRVEDFDDEEEFLVAGGDAEDAKTRKEWGMALLNKVSVEDDDNVDDKEDKSKKALEEKRKMYRESEKLMRERRCLIKPAPVVKRSFKDLLAKVEARVSKVVDDHTALTNARPTPASNEQIRVAAVAGDAAPPAIHAQCVAAAGAQSKSLVVDDDDDDDDEIIIRGNTVPGTPVQLPRVSCILRNANAFASASTCASAAQVTESDAKTAIDLTDKQAEVQAKVKSPKKGSALTVKAFVNVMSPTKERKERKELRNNLLRKAQSRSEHLIAAQHAGIKLKSELRPPPHNFSVELDLDAQPDPFPNLTIAFIASSKYVGHKRGYVFHMASRGLGYYMDGAEKAEEEEEEEEEEDVFDGASKKSRVKLTTNDSGLEDSDDDVRDPTQDAITPAHLRSETGPSLESHLDKAGVKESSGEKGVNETPEEGEEQTVEKAKERTSIFRSFMGIDGEREVTDMQLLDTANAAVVKPAVTTAPPVVPAKPAANRKYGQHGIAAMLRKQQETATSAASASLLPQKVPGPAKSCNVGWREPDVAWREPDLDESDEDECEGDDEADAEVDDEDEEEEEEEDETEDDEEEDEDEDNAEKEGPAKKKSLNDVLSIKKNTLRLGTLDAGYLRNEENAMGYHDDIGIAKEDLEDGIDLMDTDGEDAEEEEEDSEEERRVAEGFIEDAQFAETLGLNAEELQEFFQRQREETDEKENQRILDVIRGDVRRRKAAGQEDSWVPNRAARQRGMALGQVPVGFSGAMLQNQDDELEEGQEGDAAASAARAAERVERIKWLQEQKQRDLEKAQLELEELEAKEAKEATNHTRTEADLASRSTIRRINSRTGPTLAAFGRQLSGVFQGSGQKPKVALGDAAVAEGKGRVAADGGGGGNETAGAEVEVVEGGDGASTARLWRKVNTMLSTGLIRKSNSSMLGVESVVRAGGKQETEAGAASKEKEGKIGISRNFFFQTVRKDGADIIQDQPLTSNILPLPPGASTGQVPKRSTTGAAFTTKRKSSSGGGAGLKRQKSSLLTALTD